MATLNRNKKTQTISELETYYAKRSNRTGMAWLMAFFSLLITILVLAGLFFGGRWIYRAITDDNADQVATTSDGDGVPTGTVDENGNVEGPDNSANGADETTSDEEFPQEVTGEAATTDEPSDSDEGEVAGSSEDIPNTGPGDVLFILPGLAFVVGYFYSRKRQLNK